MRSRFLLLSAILVSLASCSSGDVSDDVAPLADADPEPEPLVGRWNLAPGAPEVAEMQAEMIEQLEALGYSQGSMEAGEASGVILYNEDRAMAGYNLYNSGHDPMASIMDMRGTVLHTWSVPFEDVFGRADPRNPNCFFWRRVLLLPEGDLLAIHEGQGILRMDNDSKPIWSDKNGAHHDLAIDLDGNLVVLTKKTRVVDRLHEVWPCTEDFVTTMTLDGETIGEFSLLEAFENSPYADMWYRTLGTYDFEVELVNTMHTNTISVLDGRHVDKHEGFKKGNLLMSSLKMSTIFTANPETGVVEWAWQGGWHGIHEPSMLENGDILFYVNSMFKFGNVAHSRIFQCDPISREITWEFGGPEPPKGFISPFCGTVMRLPNGNTLVTASESGRALETTMDGTVVWDYYSPHRTGENDELVGTLFHVERLPLDTNLSWMDE